MKYVWFFNDTGEFSNSFSEEDYNDYIKDDSDLIRLSKERGAKLIKFECLTDPNFEFMNIMKVVRNTEKLGLSKKYNLFNLNVKVNNKPLTLKQAEQQQSDCIMNYGYKPDIIPV